MGFKVDYGEMQSLLGTYNTAIGEWSEGISSVMEKVGSIEASTNIAGNSADRLRAYLNMAYSCANSSLSMLLETFRQNFLLYIEAYYREVDASSDTCIDEAELNDRHTKLEGKRSRLQQIGLSAESAVQGISDLVAVPSLSIGEPDMVLGNILTSLDKLDTAVNSLESAHVSADFTSVDALITQLEAYIKELYSLKKEFKADFTIQNFVNLATVPALIQATQSAYEQLTVQESDVAIVIKNLEKRLGQESTDTAKQVLEPFEKARNIEKARNQTCGHLFLLDL